MKTICSVSKMKDWSERARQKGGSIGFVPTMGFLHDGHLSLVRESMSTCSSTVVSVFVNAKQFGPDEDFDTYPIDMDGDKKLLESLGVDVLFYPSQEEIYPEGHTTYVTVRELSDRLCGKSRPGFFQGVTTVVLKLFNIVRPHIAFFGEKDRQQLGVIKTMARDLNLDVSIKGLPIIREPDGLALSSRNHYLSKAERVSSRSLYRALERAKELVLDGENSMVAIKSEMVRIIEMEKDAQVDYISLCDPMTFIEKEKIDGKTLVALAVHIGATRLIDNCILETPRCKK